MNRPLRTLLYDYLAGELDEAGRAVVEDRLAHDASVRAEFDEMRAAQEALGTLRERVAPPPPLDHIQTRINHGDLDHGGFDPRPALPLDGEGTRFYRRLALAATVLLAVTVGLWSFDKLGSNGSTSLDAGATGRTGNTPVLRNLHRPSRNLHRVVEFGRNEHGISAERFLRELERVGIRPSEIKPSDLEYFPAGHVLPIAADD